MNVQNFPPLHAFETKSGIQAKFIGPKIILSCFYFWALLFDVFVSLRIINFENQFFVVSIDTTKVERAPGKLFLKSIFEYCNEKRSPVSKFLERDGSII